MAAAAAVMAAQAGQTASTFVAQRRQANSVMQAGNYNATLARQNATLADQQAADLLQRGNDAALRQTTRTRLIAGDQRAGMAAQGLDVNNGSAADITSETRTLGALDALTIKNNAARQAWGYQVDANNYRNEATLDTTEAANQAGALRAKSWMTLLNGASDLYGTYRDRPRIGSFLGGTDQQASAGVGALQKYQQRKARGGY